MSNYKYKESLTTVTLLMICYSNVYVVRNSLNVKILLIYVYMCTYIYSSIIYYNHIYYTVTAIITLNVELSKL